MASAGSLEQMEIKMFASTTTIPALLCVGWLIAPHRPRSPFSYYPQCFFSRAANWHIFQPLFAFSKSLQHSFISRDGGRIGKRRLLGMAAPQSKQLTQVIVDRQATKRRLDDDGARNLRRNFFIDDYVHRVHLFFKNTTEFRMRAKKLSGNIEAY